MVIRKIKSSATKKRKKTRFRKVSMKFSDCQKKHIDNYCFHHHTTLNRFIKKAIDEYLSLHSNDLPAEEPVSKNQLKLFDTDEFKRIGKQTNIFET